MFEAVHRIRRDGTYHVAGLSPGPLERIMETSRTRLITATVMTIALLSGIAIWAQSTFGRNLLPHAFCITGSEPLLVLHVLGDSLIAFSYLLIPWALFNFVRQRRDVPFGWITWLFGAFILACGATHAVEVWTLWVPVYWYAGVLKAFTAAVSLGTAWVLYIITPQLLAIPSVSTLREANVKLLEEVDARRNAEHALSQAKAELEVLLAERSRQAEQAENRSAELSELLEEMESFASSIAHDLRAPLTTMSGFSQVLLNTEGAQLSARGIGYLERIKRASAKMEEIIAALLYIAQLPHQELRSEQVDLGEMARNSVADLQATEPSRATDIQIAEPLPARGDAVLLRQVISNLLANSWKFSGGREVVKIEVGAQTVNGRTSYFVRDEGTGFDSAQAPKLFEMFHRLHSDNEFPGTGVGLAIVKRIIKRHGGEVWADAAPGQGACFRFTLAV
jgi:signal transduction histidine kinase